MELILHPKTYLFKFLEMVEIAQNGKLSIHSIWLYRISALIFSIIYEIVFIMLQKNNFFLC